MIEFGIVENTSDGYADIKINRKTECEKCGMCLFPNGIGYTVVKAQNRVGANIGDKVQIEMGGNKLLSIVFAFLIPLVLIGFSVLINYFFIKNELSVLVCSLILIAIWYFILSKIDKKCFGNDKNYITKIIK